MRTKSKQQDWTPAQIRAALYAAQGGLGAQTVIARELKVTQSMVGKVIDGHVSDRVRKAIAAYLGVAPEEIWPSIYLAGNVRQPGRPRAKHRSAA